MASSPELLHYFPPFLQVYNDGRIERLITTPRLPPSTDPITGVQSRDVVISFDHETKSRIFLPKINPQDPPKKLPLIIYIHGGGFCIGSPVNIVTHSFLTPLVSQTPAVAIAVGYRLAPENPLPTRPGNRVVFGLACRGLAGWRVKICQPKHDQFKYTGHGLAGHGLAGLERKPIYDPPTHLFIRVYRLAELPALLPTAYHDCWAAFKWIAAHSTGSGPDPWINDYVDTSRVFLVGESAGANLAHYVTVQAGVSKPGLDIQGLIALHPYFSEKEPDKMIQYLYPGSSSSDDDPKLNPRSDPDLEKMGCSRVFIMVAEKDFLKQRGIDYMETLKKSKWEGSVEFVENEGEDHCFYLFNPRSEKAKGVIQMLISFVNQA
uniref:Alpha/beta hydrolase fold-3 domain-containing protein n=1 Tax=Lactuca sativa TaxID=4236 RepID=A0A9R1UDW2_LACSA|nr:hypothetical protein LSAT_V11C900500230 [Lactuca sativa]